MSLAWGGYAIGQIPLNAMTVVRGEHFEPGAARNLLALEAAFKAAHGHECPILSGYRSKAQQQALYDGWKQGLPGFNPANKPGFSNHEWGRAADFMGEVDTFGTAEHTWMVEHGPAHGWVWGEAKAEPWHFTYYPGTATASLIGEKIMALDAGDKVFLNNLGQAIIDQIRGEGQYDYSARPSTLKRVLDDIGYIHVGSADSLKVIHAAILAIEPSVTTNVTGKPDLTPILDAIKALPDATVAAIKNAL